jgi:hypothetical protein
MVELYIQQGNGCHILLHGCETWTIRAYQIRSIEAAQIFLRWVVGYTLLDKVDKSEGNLTHAVSVEQLISTEQCEGITVENA